jgi:hypothetical protein
LPVLALPLPLPAPRPLAEPLLLLLSCPLPALLLYAAAAGGSISSCPRPFSSSQGCLARPPALLVLLMWLQPAAASAAGSLLEVNVRVTAGRTYSASHVTA